MYFLILFSFFLVHRDILIRKVSIKHVYNILIVIFLMAKFYLKY